MIQKTLPHTVMIGTVKIYYLKGGFFMSATQKTPHYNLPIYASGDETGWLSGFNPAMQTIDTSLFNINQTAEDANGTATEANTNAQQAINSNQATANLLAQTNNTVAGLVNKLTFHRIHFTEAAGVACGGESNIDGSLTFLFIQIYGKDTIPSSYTVNGIAFHELANCDEKLSNTVLSGSVTNGFTGLPKVIGFIPLKLGEENTTNGIDCFYDNNAKKTRFGITKAANLKANDSNSSCTNITFSNAQVV